MDKKFFKKIIAQSPEDLQIISACCSEAKVKTSEIKFLPSNKIFLLSLLRFDKENENNKKSIYSIIKFEFIEFSKSKNNNHTKEAERLNQILQPVHHAMFVESNPSPVKYAAKLLDLCDDAVRLPLVTVTEKTKEIIKKTLSSAKLL